MITLTFNKGTDSQHAIALNSFNESVTRGLFNGAYTEVISPSGNIPSYDEFRNFSLFETLDATDDSGNAIPISGEYHRISDLSTNYDDTTKRFGMNIVLTRDVG